MIRKIHLDFHTHPDTTDVGAGFDPEAFAETLANAHVNALATPGKCQYGNIYQAVEHGVSHPQLCSPDLFSATVAACARRGIQVQAYWNLGTDLHAARKHPEWRQRYVDGSYAQWGEDCPHMCFASGYVEEQVIPNTVECIKRCPELAGFWFDICLYLEEAYYSDAFEREAQARLGARSDEVAARWQLARTIIRERCQQIDEAVRAHLPDADNYFNSLVCPGDRANIALQAWQEVENPLLFHSPEKMTSHTRWLRNHDAQVIGLVSRFHGPWCDPGTLRSADQLRFDVARTVSLGSHISMGDHRHPNGSLEPELYRRLGPVYKEVKDLETWLEQTVHCREAVLLAPIVEGSGLLPDFAPEIGQMSRLLEELGVQFDLANDCSTLRKTDLVIWPSCVPATDELVAALIGHQSAGGEVLAFNPTLTAQDAEALFGIRLGAQPPATEEEHPEQFIRPRQTLTEVAFSAVVKQPTATFEPHADATILADRMDRACQGPAFPVDVSSGVLAVAYGNSIFCGCDVLAVATEEDQASMIHLLDAFIARALGTRLVSHDAGPTVSPHLHQGDGIYVLHLVHWACDRWDRQANMATHFPTLAEIRVKLRTPQNVRAVTLQPNGESLDFVTTDGGIAFTVPRLHIWQVVLVQAAD